MQFLDIFVGYVTLASSVLLVFVTPKVVDRVRVRGPAPWASTAIKVHSRISSLFSLSLLLAIALSSKPAAKETRLPFPNYTDLTLRYIYQFSTIYDSISVLLTLCAGGTVSRYSAFYHVTLPYLSFMRILHHSSGWRVFAAVNTLHNTLRYAYLGGATTFRPILPVTVWAQLVLGMATDGYLMGLKHSRAGTPVWPNFVSACLLGVCLLLYLH